MRWVRNDITAVPPQGADVAAQCPVRAQWDELRPAAPTPPSDLDLRRQAASQRAIDELIGQLVARAPGAVAIDPDSPDAHASTFDAIGRRAPVIVGAQLPPDPVARRASSSTVLVADPDGGYHSVVVSHLPTRSDRRGVGGRSSSLDRPGVSASTQLDQPVARRSKGHLLRLAHERRLLESCGAAADSEWGGALGAEATVTWYDLGEPLWRTPSTSEGTKLRSTTDVYDFEFEFRLDVVAVARRLAGDPSADPSASLLVVPVRTSECSRCPWQQHCRSLMVERNDVSLLPYASWRMWSLHRGHGVRTVDDLAALDRRTAALLDAGVDLAGLDPLVDGLDPRVVAYSGAAPKNFAESIDLARARSADSPVHLRRGVDQVLVPRAAVEVDIDLESTDAGVYLWGALVTDRAATGLVTEGYRSFLTWEHDLSATEVGVFERFAEWLSALRASVKAAGHSFAVYCYNERAEAAAMQRLATLGTGQRWVEWVDELVSSDDWLDLYAVAQRHLITGDGMGLKHLAQIAGFAWEDDDPGGLQSMQWHHLATTDADAGVRAANRQRILTYNRNDVEATLALREWMDQHSAAVPNVADLEPTPVASTGHLDAERADV